MRGGKIKPPGAWLFRSVAIYVFAVRRVFLRYASILFLFAPIYLLVDCIGMSFLKTECLTVPTAVCLLLQTTVFCYCIRVAVISDKIHSQSELNTIFPSEFLCSLILLAY